MSNLIQICPVGADPLTDMSKILVAFRNFRKRLKTVHAEINPVCNLVASPASVNLLNPRRTYSISTESFNIQKLCVPSAELTSVIILAINTHWYPHALTDCSS